MMEMHIFLFSFVPPNRSDKEWQLCTTEGPTPVFKRLGGEGKAIDGRNIYFLFSYFPNMSGISAVRVRIFFWANWQITLENNFFY